MSRVLQRGRLISSPIRVLERAAGAVSLREKGEKWMVEDMGVWATTSGLFAQTPICLFNLLSDRRVDSKSWQVIGSRLPFLLVWLQVLLPFSVTFPVVFRIQLLNLLITFFTKQEFYDVLIKT